MKYPTASVAIGLIVVGCGGAVAPAGEAELEDTGGKIRARVASTVAEVSAKRLTRDHYRIHFIDVGSGLAVLVQGTDFNLLFDGGSADDSRGIVAAGKP